MDDHINRCATKTMLKMRKNNTPATTVYSPAKRGKVWRYFSLP